MFGFFPVFFSRSASFFCAAAAWLSCGITFSMFGAISTVWATNGSATSSACKRASSTDPISRAMDRDMGAAVLLAAVLAAAGAGRAMLLSPASAVPAPTPLKKSRRVSFMFFLLCKLADKPC